MQSYSMPSNCLSLFRGTTNCSSLHKREVTNLSFMVAQLPGRKGSLWSLFGYLSSMAPKHSRLCMSTAFPFLCRWPWGCRKQQEQDYQDQGSGNCDWITSLTKEYAAPCWLQNIKFTVYLHLLRTNTVMKGYSYCAFLGQTLNKFSQSPEVVMAGLCAA